MLRIQTVSLFSLFYGVLIFSMELPEKDPYEVLAELIRSTGDYRLIDYNCLSVLIGSESPLSYEDIVKFSEQQVIHQKTVVLPTSSTYNALEQIGGIFPEPIKKIVNSLKNEQRREQLRLPPIRAVLLYGPSGIGKTAIVRAIAEAIGWQLLEKNVSHFGNNPQQKKINVVNAFEEAKSHNKPILFFIDEIDALTLTSNTENPIVDLERYVAAELDNCFLNNPNVLIVAATNKIHRLSKIILRRFGRNIIEIPFPDIERRIELLKAIIKNYPVIFLEHQIEAIAHETNNFSITDLKDLVEIIIEIAYDENKQSTDLIITDMHIKVAISKVKKALMLKGDTRVRNNTLFMVLQQLWGYLYKIIPSF